jgi:hypothetical protein
MQEEQDKRIRALEFQVRRLQERLSRRGLMCAEPNCEVAQENFTHCQARLHGNFYCDEHRPIHYNRVEYVRNSTYCSPSNPLQFVCDVCLATVLSHDYVLLEKKK